VRFDLKTGEATDTIPVELHPNAVLSDEARGRLYVANGNKDSVSVIDTDQNRVARTIEIQPFKRKVTGIAPTARALSGDGAKLYVACDGINAIAVVSTSSGAVDGMIPTAWYPNGLSLSPDGQYLAVSTLLGTGAGWRDEPKQRYVHAYRGSLSVLLVPTRDGLASGC
jgi:YVTN family beta-propeller protein